MTKYNYYIPALILFILANFMPGAVHANDAAQAFMDGLKAYKSGDFTDAAAAFEKAAKTGIKNEKLYYNLGNACLKSGDTGRAILWYERALKLAPGDPDLRFNYEYALSFVKDEKGDKTSPVLKILFFWKYLLGSETVRYMAVGLNAAFWLLAAVCMVRRRPVFNAAGYILLSLAVIFTATAGYNYYEAARLRQAIVLPEKISVRSGLDENATELFVLHAGTRVRVEREKADFYRIYFSEGKIGWVRKTNLGLI